MSDGKHCPACGKDIGIWPIFSAVRNRFRCPHCRVRLSYQGIRWLVLALLVLAVPLVAASLYLVRKAELTGLLHDVAFLGILLALWVPVELLVTAYLRSTKVLSRVDAQ